MGGTFPLALCGISSPLYILNRGVIVSARSCVAMAAGKSGLMGGHQQQAKSWVLLVPIGCLVLAAFVLLGVVPRRNQQWQPLTASGGSSAAAEASYASGGGGLPGSRPRCIHGELLIGKCFCDPGFTGVTCEEQDSWTPPPCNETSDVCFWSRENGVCKVSVDRWQRAQAAESRLWRSSTGTNDRVSHHMDGFNKYDDVPEFLGSVLEVGCGPWTQFGFVLDLNRTWIINNITLWEPGAEDYIANVSTCAFKDGKLRGRPVTIVNKGAEEIQATAAYDTIFVINLLDHVVNMFEVLENVHRALKPGGILVFHDRWWDRYDITIPVNESFYWGLDHVYHPMRCNRRVFAHYLSKYYTYYKNINHKHITDFAPWYKGIYFIGMKL